MAIRSDPSESGRPAPALPLSLTGSDEARSIIAVVAADGLYSAGSSICVEVFVERRLMRLRVARSPRGADGGGSLRFDLRELAAIFVGGFAGAVARAELLEAIPHRVGSWPWATFIVNVVGAFMLGYFATRLQERLPVSAYRRPLLGTGLCGALTTFSTMQVELLRMLDAGLIGLAFAYAL